MTPTSAERASLRRIVLGLAVLLVVAACGTGEVTLDEPVPELFPDDSTAPDVQSSEAETSTTTTTTVPVADRLPALTADVSGAVVTPTGIIVPVVGPTETGWTVRTPCGREIGLDVGTVVGPAHVVIDPGHGGSETGAVGEGGLEEAEVNLAVAQRVAAALEAEGVTVVLTRSTDVRVTLATRAEIAAAVGALAFVSIHHNADPDGASEGPGTETWYQIDDPESRRLAGLVYEEVAAALEPYDVDWVADDDAGAKYRLNQRGTDYYGILRESAGTPAVLAELAFLSNPPEEALLATEAFRDAEAAAVADAVIRFLVTDDAGSGFVEPYDRVEPAGPGGGSTGCEDPALS